MTVILAAQVQLALSPASPPLTPLLRGDTSHRVEQRRPLQLSLHPFGVRARQGTFARLAHDPQASALQARSTPPQGSPMKADAPAALLEGFVQNLVSVTLELFARGVSIVLGLLRDMRTRSSAHWATYVLQGALHPSLVRVAAPP